jgi:hypothetical protein
MKIGDIDVANSLLNLESKIMVMDQMFKYIFENNPNIKKPSPRIMEIFHNNAIGQLQKKYPNMGIKKKSR